MSRVELLVAKRPRQARRSPVGIAAVLQHAHVHLLGRDFNPLLGDEYAHPARVGRAGAIVKLFGDIILYPVDTTNLSCPFPRDQS
jgi:hypothetical protein